jgi:hypothetical protein
VFACLVVCRCQVGMACSDEDHSRNRRLGAEDRGWSHMLGTRWPGDREIGWHRVRSTPCTWRRGAWVSWLSLKTMVDGLSVVWPKNHWDGFSSVWASKPMATVCEWFGLKTTRTVFTGLASKPVVTVSASLASKPAATVFSGLASKLVVTVSSGLASKPAATVSSGLASKLAATVSSGLASKPAAMVFFGLASKPVVTVFSSLVSKQVATASPSLASKLAVGFLVEPQNQGGGWFPNLGIKTGSFGLVIWASKTLWQFLGLGLKTKWASVCRLHHKTNGGRSA